MIMHRHLHRVLPLVFGCVLLSGCASGSKAPANTVFDFGPAVATAAVDTAAVATAAAPTATTSPLATGTIRAVVVADVTGSAALDSERMFYRLNYANPLEARTYAHSRWSATPLQLLTQRFKVRLAQSGMRVLSATDAADGLPILRIEIDDFNHTFDSAAESHGVVAIRASLFQSHKLLDQRTFTRRTPGGTDASAGARALAGSTDAVAADLAAWMAAVPLPTPQGTVPAR